MSALDELNRFTARLAEQIAELAGEVRDLKARVVELEAYNDAVNRACREAAELIKAAQDRISPPLAEGQEQRCRPPFSREFRPCRCPVGTSRNQCRFPA